MPSAGKAARSRSSSCHSAVLARDEVEAILGEAGDGELADDAALGVERVAEADPAGLRQARAEQPVEHRRGAGALQHELGEAAQVDHAHRLAHSLHLGRDETIPVAVAAQGQRRLLDRAGGIEEGGPLPAIAGGEAGALGGQDRDRAA